MSKEGIKQIHIALSLLNSMVNCGEQHSKQSIEITKKAFEIVKNLNTSDVVGRNEQLICPCCGSDKTYKTDAIHCNRCAVTTEI